MRKPLVAFVLLMGVGGSWWLWSRDRSDARRATPLAATHPAATIAPEPATELGMPTRVPEVAASSTDATDEAAPATIQREAVASLEGGGPDLVVQALDPSGAPLAGILLVLETGEGDSGTVPESCTSDASGRASFANVRARIAQAPQPWTLLADLPFERPPRLVLDAAALAHPAVIATLPGGGPLDVRVIELDGAPAPHGSTLRLRLVPEGASDVEAAGHEWCFDLDAGAENVPWVELGRTWELIALRPDGSLPTRARVRGPSSTGQRVEVELVLGSEHPVVSFRVLDPARRPLAGAEIQLAQGDVIGSLRKTALITDALGRFTIDGRGSPLEEASFTVTCRPEGAATLEGSARLPRNQAVGWNDGGDILLEADPLLCAGRVLDERGVPVSGAKVIAGKGDWSFDERRTDTRSDQLGRFELRGMWNEEEFTLHGEGAGSRSEDRLTRQGETGVTLVLAPRFGLSGRLALDPGLDPRAIGFRVQATGANPISLHREGSPLRPFVPIPGVRGDPPEVFRLEPIRAGTYDLGVVFQDFELARLDGLVLHDDLDVGTIDLRGILRTVEIHIERAPAPSALTGKLSWWPSDGGARRGAQISGEVVTLVSPQLPIDVELRPRGFRSVLLANVSSHHRVTLAPALRVRVVLETDGELPASSGELGCELFAGDASVGHAQGSEHFTDEDRELEFLVSTPGVLRVSWRLEGRFEGANFGGSWARTVLEDLRQEIEVLDVPGEQVFNVPLDGAALTELSRHWP